MPQPPRNDGWKQTPKPNPAHPPTAHPAPHTSRRPWQPGAPKVKSTARKTSRAAKFVAAGVGVGLLTAAVVVVILWLQPSKYPAVVVVAPDTPDSLALPENAAGVASARGVEEWANGDSRAKLTAGRDATADRDAWRTRIDPNAKGTVLYFAAHAGADAKGPYLWQAPKGAVVADTDKLYVADVIQRLAELRGQPALLVLDIAQTPPNWAFGGAFNDFVRAVKDLDAEIEKVNGLAVLLSADEGQVSWVADEWRRSAFGFYFVEGLRGAAGSPGGPVNAAELHTYLKGEVQKWAVANRGVNQEPLLLPKGSGSDRAKKLELVTLPPTGYTPPAKPTAAPATPELLRSEWKRAAALAALSPSPDTTDPLNWQQYLEWLMRWDRLVRLDGADGPTVVPASLPPRVKRLGDELQARAADDAECGGVALPAGLALSGAASDKPTNVSFARLWEPPGESTHADEWAKLIKDADTRREQAVRTAAARFVLDKVLADGVSRASLETADRVLRAIGGVLPTEAHYLRMLHLHLPGDPKKRTADDVKSWPSAELLRTAITLRRTAEETAWADGLAYPEQAFRWTAKLVDAADAQRQTAEDLLFDVDTKSREEAAGLFEQAKKGYATASQRAKLAADALTVRDRVFARLPYYARWLASPRGGPANADELLGQLERAAAAAHAIDKLFRDVPSEPTATDEEVLAKSIAAAAGIDDVAKAYDSAAKHPGGQVQESNWHALDALQSVPFRKMELGPDLAQRARTVGLTLAVNAQQPAGTRAADLDLNAAAAHHLRAAAAHLNDPTLARGSGLGEKPVKLADDLAAALRGLPGKASGAVGTADAQDTLRAGGAALADADRLARLGDAAAPAGGSPTPPEATRRFWRHYLLLGQARRITVDGWCSDNPAEQNVARWYCVQAAKLVHASADAELGKLVPGRGSLPPARLARLTDDLTQEQKRMPTVLQVKAAPTRVVVPDERHLRYTYDVRVTQGERIGLPVAEYELPAGMATVNAKTIGRRLERRLTTAKGEAVAQSATFAFGPERATGADTVAGIVRYRGRVYRSDTNITFSGEPNLRLENVPPSGKAVMFLQADPEAVSGAVTLLIDITNSMSTDVPGSKNNRLEEAFVGVEELLKRIPPGTQLRLGTFVGRKPDGGGFELDVQTLVPEFTVKGGDNERKQVMGRVRTAKLVDPSCTPVAGAIAYALDPKLGAGLWPRKFTGGKTLIVLTDGDDNWEEFGTGYRDRKGRRASPGDAVKEAIVDAVADPDASDVTVHLALFAMDTNAVKRAKEQFKYLEDVADLQDRGRFHLAAQVKDGADFARQLGQAVMPRVRYKSDRAKGVMVASLKDEPVYNPTPELPPGSFTLTDGVNKLPVVQLADGERVALRAVRKGDRITLTRPPFALELARANDRPKETAGQVALTVPELRHTASTPRTRLDAVITFEELDPAVQNDILRAPTRYLAWFDLTYPEGQAFDPEHPPRVTIRNHLESNGLTAGPRTGHELLAPAWDVTVKDWDVPGNNPRNYRRPTVSGYWVNGLPDAKAVQNVSPSQVKEAPSDTLSLKAFTFGTGKVPVLDVAVSDRDGKLFLTVWMDYERSGELVFLRADGWKGGRVPESHTYYDKHHRYTAEYGPFPVEDLTSPLRLELYSVADLRQQAIGNQRAVTLKGATDTTDQHTLPRGLFANPPK